MKTPSSYPLDAKANLLQRRRLLPASKTPRFERTENGRDRRGKIQRRERERERDKDPEKKQHPAHTRTRYKGGIEEEEEEKLFHSLLPPISLGEIWKLPSSTISSLPRFLLFYCSSIYFGCCRREHRSIQMMMKYPQDFNSTLLIVFDAERHSKKRENNATSQEKDAEQKIRQEHSLFQFLELPTYGFLCWILMYFTWQALGVAKGNNKRLDQEALYTTELDKINIIDDTTFVSFRLQYSQLAFLKQSKQNRNV